MPEPPAKLAAVVDRCFAAGVNVRSLATEIVAAASPIAVRAARALNLRQHDVEDVAQHASAKLVEMLERGERPRGNVEALVWRMAENRSRDIHRARKRRTDGKQRLTQELRTANQSSPNPEAIWLTRERQAWAQTIVRDALEEAPKLYRIAIRRHYLEGVPVEELANGYYATLVAAGEVNEADPASAQAAARKARNRADQHLKRGRDWLRRRLAEHLDKDES
ncbi:MAG: sigma-70 family RNA polymerase sigma factor [Deltaproteobacteria bacterium]|nr:sigma-70 family RNA polymerase sigma factor [Deltaproteobacteria bacterium]